MFDGGLFVAKRSCPARTGGFWWDGLASCIAMIASRAKIPILFNRFLNASIISYLCDARERFLYELLMRLGDVLRIAPEDCVSK